MFCRYSSILQDRGIPPTSSEVLENKVNALVELLSHINFSQCLIFSNYQMRLVYSLRVSLLLLFPIFVMGFRLVLKVYFAITERYIVLNHFCIEAIIAVMNIPVGQMNYLSFTFLSFVNEKCMCFEFKGTEFIRYAERQRMALCLY